MLDNSDLKLEEYQYDVLVDVDAFVLVTEWEPY